MRCSRYLRDAPASQPTRFTNYFNHCIHPCLSKSSAYFKCHEEMPFQLIHLWLTYFSCKPLHSISVHPAILSKLMVQLQAGGYCTRMRSKTTKQLFFAWTRTKPESYTLNETEILKKVDSPFKLVTHILLSSTPMHCLYFWLNYVASFASKYYKHAVSSDVAAQSVPF